jgi:hypothetical protein
MKAEERQRIHLLWSSERGMTEMISLMIVLSVFLFVSFSMVSFMTFMLRQEKLESIHHRALEMSTQEGYFTPTIQADTLVKLASIGFPQVTKEGVSYPSFGGSTASKLYRDDLDATIKLIMIYPATGLQRIVGLLGGSSTEEDGYYRIEGVGRSEAYH